MKFKYLIALLVLLPQLALANADIKFAEQRINFDGKKRTGKLTVINQGDQPATAELVFKKLVFYPDKTSGTMLEYADEYNKYPYNVDVLSMLKFSPRKIYLEPGKRQAFRIFLKKPQDLPDGEYRIFVFLDIKETEEELGKKTEQKLADGAIGLGVKFKTSYGIPVFIRHGNIVKNVTDIKDITIKKLSFEESSDNSSHILNLTYVNDSNAVAAGFAYLYGMQGKKEVLLTKRPLSLYPDNKEQIAEYRFLPEKKIENYTEFKLKLVDKKETTTYLEKTFNVEI